MKINLTIKRILYAVTGLVSTVLGIICYCFYTGGYESAVRYGGDAYTGIQNAAAQTANNIECLGDICKFGFGSILLIAGLVMIIYAVTLCKAKEECPESVAVQVNKDDETKTCPGCGREYTGERNFCPNCGFMIKDNT